jgi:hypothetical protein
MAQIWDPSAGLKPTNTLVDHKAAVYDVGSAGNVLVTGSRDHSVKVKSGREGLKP